MIIVELMIVCAAGGLGAASRFLVDRTVRRQVPTRFPLPTMIINVTGSLVLGLLTGLAPDSPRARDSPDTSGSSGWNSSWANPAPA